MCSNVFDVPTRVRMCARFACVPMLAHVSTGVHRCAHALRMCAHICPTGDSMCPHVFRCAHMRAHAGGCARVHACTGLERCPDVFTYTTVCRVGVAVSTGLNMPRHAHTCFRTRARV